MSTELTSYEDCMNELNELKDLFHSLRTNCEFKGKDSEGAVHYHFEPGYNASLAFAQVHSHIKALESFLKEHTEPLKQNEAAELLTWLDAHPSTTNSLAVITTKSGTYIQLWNKDPDPGDGIRIAAENLSSAPEKGYKNWSGRFA